MVNKWIKSKLFGVYPSSCVLCGESGMAQLDLCSACCGDLAPLENSCYSCGLPLGMGEFQCCGSCLKNTPYFDHTVCGYRYQQPFSLFVQRMKFSSALQYVSILAELHSNFVIEHECCLPEILLPVPLHPQRVCERGFNQALELSKVLSRRLDIPFSTAFCHRHRAVPAQRGLSAKQRRVNLRNAFSTQLPRVKHIALVDDVMTTGSTFNEIAKGFKALGVERVDVWPMARAT